MSGRWIWGLAVLGTASALALWTLSGAGGIPVQVAQVRRGRVEESVSATRAGTLKARVQVVLGAQAAGRVESLRHREMERVAKGEPICLLEAAELDARLAQAGQSLAEAERKLRHLEELLTRQAVSREERDQAATRLALERAAVDLARAQRDKAVLAAPFDGLIADTFVEPGQWVLPGTAVCEFLDDSAYHVEAEVDEIDSARLKEGQPVHLTVDALPGERFEGILSYLAPAVSTAQEKNRTVTVKVAWTGDKARVKPGMSVGVEVVVGAAGNVLFVPSPALIDRGGRRLVYRVLGGRVEEREVAAGIGNWETTAVTAGLEEGDLVVLSLGDPDLKPGAKVAPTEEAK